MTARQPIERRANYRIRELLHEWACWHYDNGGLGYPSEVSFAKMRVQVSRASEIDQRVMPPDVERLDKEIAKLAPGNKNILRLEYLDRRPQKTKAAVLQMPRQVFSARLLWIHEHLEFAMWG